MGSLPVTTPPRRPGIMLVGPRLKEPSPDSAAKFLRWTKLHFRDMLSIPEFPSLGRMTHALRFSNPESAKYSFDKEKGYSPYFYTLHIEDIGIVQSEPYYAVSRRLDLENTRELGKEEEPVGQEGLVFDIVDADFAVFEEVTSAIPMNTQIASYQHLGLPLAASHGKMGTPPSSHLVALSIKTPEPDVFALKGMIPTSVLGLQASLLSHLSSSPSKQNPPGSTFKVSTSLYRHAGKEAQPDMHPEIDCEAGGKWLVTALLVDDEGELGKREDVEGWVEQWANTIKEGEKSIGLSYGVWGGEVFMS